MDIFPLKLVLFKICQEIFQNLPISLLFNCVLVDWQLCSEIIPLLWKEPLDLLSPTKIWNYSRIINTHTQVVNSYIKCLSPDKRIYLIMERIMKISASETPLFDYP